jgi:tetratricopeptide (TPR) repeat protein
VDLEQEIQKPFSQIPKQAKAPEVHEKPAPAPEPAGLDSLEELKAQISIAENYLKQGLVEEAIEVYQQLAEAHPENAEVKQKLNQAYTAYVKTGDEVIGALEAEKKAKEDEEKRLRAEMEVRAQEEAKRLREELEQKARLEADIKARVELEKKAREEAEKKAREEMERLAKGEEEQKIRLEAERRAKEESERKTREEADRKLREETEKKVREEIAKKMEQEAKKASVAHDQATARTPPTSKGDVLEENRDDFMTIAVADIYVRQQLYEEAVKIYRRIVQMEPDNLEAKKKLGDTEAMIKSKGSKPASEPSATTPMESTPSKPAENHTPPPHSSGPEKDSGGKKKSNRVGYV